MKSPFPGMDPYLERSWGDVHARLIIYAGDQLQEQLPRDLRCRVEERIMVASDVGPRHDFYPDLRVVPRPGQKPGPGAVATLVAAEPMLISVESDPATETFLEIIDVATGKQVVTVLEILSPANKAKGKDHKKYLKKQKELRKSKVNLVEIDLLRDGRRTQALREARIPKPARTPYRVCVSRASTPDHVEYYPISLRERLPAIRIPLRQADNDVILDLQNLVDQAYDKGRYDDIDYKLPPDPPLSGADVVWAQELLRQAGKG